MRCHLFPDFSSSRERRLCFEGPPEKSKDAPAPVPRESQPGLVSEFDTLKKDIGAQLAEERKLHKDVRSKLVSMKNTFSKDQLQEIQNILDPKKLLEAEDQELIRRLGDEYLERLQQEAQPIVETGEAAMKAIEQSGMPEWVKATFKMIGDNPVMQFIQKSYYSLMANLEKILPQSFKSFLPFLQEQIDGSKAMLEKLGARDGIQLAVDGYNGPQRSKTNLAPKFDIEWGDFDLLWETWKPACEEAQKANPKLTSKEFARRKMHEYLSTMVSLAGTTLVVDLGDLAVAKKAEAAATPAPQAGAPEVKQKPVEELPQGLERGKPREIKADEIVDVASGGVVYRVGRGVVRIGNDLYKLELDGVPAESVRVTLTPPQQESLDASMLSFMTAQDLFFGMDVGVPLADIRNGSTGKKNGTLELRITKNPS